MTSNACSNDRWAGIRPDARTMLQTRNYASGDVAGLLTGPGLPASEALKHRTELSKVWIPGVEILPRSLHQQSGRGYFSELVRMEEGTLKQIGLTPQQWSAAMMHRDAAKGFHIHPPHIPDGKSPADFMLSLYHHENTDFNLRPYALEQWDIMFFLTGICELFLVDERIGLDRRLMRLSFTGDSKLCPDLAGVVIPPGVAHGLRSIGNEDIIMVYGTSTCFDPDCEGRLASQVEHAALDAEWDRYLSGRSD